MDETNMLDHNKYAYLRQLPVEKLLELLAAAPVCSACPEDEAYADALEEAILEKETEHPTGFFPDTDHQWEQFVAYYLPDAEKAAPESEPAERAASAQTDQQPLKASPKRVVRFSRVWRTALAAAAAIVCVLGIMLTAQAAGFDVFGTTARWTKEIFSFGTIPPDSEVIHAPARETAAQEKETQGTEARETAALDPDLEFASVQEALDACGMTEVHEPTWIPKGYTLVELDVTCLDDPFLRALAITYVDGEKSLGLDIFSYENEPNTLVQKNDAPVETVERYGITFYLIENSVGRTIAWCTGQYEYYISGELDKDILWKIVRSMYE